MPLEEITLYILGSGDAFDSGGRFQPCFYVKTTDYNFMVDCGATSLAALKRNHISPADIDAILITHFHGDHYGGLPYILLDCQYIQMREKPLTIAGPRGLRNKVLQLMELLYPGHSPLNFDYEILFIEYEPRRSFAIGPCFAEAYPVIHAEETLPHGFRVYIDSKVLAFSGDTGWTEVIYEIEKNADLFICECYLYDQAISSHLSYKRLIEKKKDFTNKRMIINHLGEKMLGKITELELEVAEDGMIVKI